MLEESVEIEELGYADSLDIEVSGNHYFFANGILTHNSASDFGMENTSESMGLVHTLDLFLALIQTEELAEQNQVLVKQLKNRYRDENRDRKFIIGMNKTKMKVYDVETSAQKGLNATDRPKPDKGQNFTKPKGPQRDFSAFS